MEAYLGSSMGIFEVIGPYKFFLVTYSQNVEKKHFCVVIVLVRLS